MENLSALYIEDESQQGDESTTNLYQAADMIDEWPLVPQSMVPLAKAIHVDHTVANNLKIEFKAGDKTKSVKVRDNLVEVKWNTKVLLLCSPNDKSGQLCQQPTKLYCWVSFVNDKDPVEIEKRSIRKRRGSSPHVFDIPGAKFQKDPEGKWIACVDEFSPNYPIQVTFVTVTSENKQGGGWIFNAQIVNYHGRVMAQGVLPVKAIQVIRDKGTDTKTTKRRSTSTDDSGRESPSCKVSKTDIDPSDLKSYSTREVWDLIKKNEKERAILMEEYEKRMRAFA